MRLFVVAALSLLLGIVIGGIGPRSELRELRQEMSELEGKACAQDSIGKDLAALLSAGAGARDASRAREEADRIAEENPEVAEQLDQMDANREQARGEVTEQLQSAAANDEELRAARTALELRRAQARAALLEDADPSPEQLDEIDSAVAEMNQGLNQLASELVNMMAKGEEPTRRDAMAFAADALDTMIIAEDRINAALDEDQLAGVDEQALDPFSYVDPALVDVLARLGR